jgi:hypothetical protein
MNTGVTKTDFIYFQNEILKDIKNLELKFNEKTDEMLKSISTNKANEDSHIKKLYDLFGEISEKISFSEEYDKINNKITAIQKKLEDLTINSRIKSNALEKEINNMTIKYDKIFISNLIVPGLIGNSCPYQSLGNFIESANKKINDLTIEKKKQGMDLKSYKDKLESLIGQFNTRINNVEEQFKEYCNTCFANYDKNSNDRFNYMEDKMNNLRMENVKYSSELIERSNELKMDWDKIQDIRKEIYDKLDVELSKFTKLNHDLLRTFESQKSEFTLIKRRFTELSDFIKDVRFRNNITTYNNNNNNKVTNNNANNHTNSNTNNNNTNSFAQLSNFQKKVKFNKMSKRINFKLKQKLDDDSFKSNKELHKYGDFQEKRENSIHYSPAKTEFNFKDNDDNDDLYSNISDIKKEEKEEKEFNIKLIDNNKEKEKENKKNYIIDKPLDMGKVGSTLKNYFNSNKGYKGKIQKSHKLLPVNPEINIKNAAEQNNSDKNNNLEKKKNKSVINKESDNEFSGEEEKIKSIINLKNKNKSAKIKDTKKENTTTQSDLEEAKFSSKNLNSIKESPNKSKKNKLNKSIKIAKTNDKHKVSSFVNSPKISVNTAVENNNDKNNKNLLTLNPTQDNKDQNNNNNEPSRTLTKNNSPLKIDTINSDKSDFSNNFKESEEKKIIKAKAKFSFITTTNNIKESSKNDMNKTIESNNPINYKNINIADERMNLDFALLNKKIINTNNRLTELYMNSDIKINKIYQYVKKVFDHFSGIFYFKEIYNQKFSFDFSPKSILTNTDFTSTLPATRNNKTKIKLKENNKFFSPKNLKKQETYKLIMDKIEPYLIKKFKE